MVRNSKYIPGDNDDSNDGPIYPHPRSFIILDVSSRHGRGRTEGNASSKLNFEAILWDGF